MSGRDFSFPNASKSFLGMNAHLLGRECMNAAKLIAPQTSLPVKVPSPPGGLPTAEVWRAQLKLAAAQLRPVKFTIRSSPARTTRTATGIATCATEKRAAALTRKRHKFHHAP